MYRSYNFFEIKKLALAQIASPLCFFKTAAATGTQPGCRYEHHQSGLTRKSPAYELFQCQYKDLRLSL